MEISKIRELCQELKSVSGFSDIAFHKIEDGGLSPLYKVETEAIPNTHWKETHHRVCLKIHEDWVLTEVCINQKCVYMPDVDKVPNAPEEFVFFNIKTNFLIPIIKDGQTVAMLVIANIGKTKELSQDQRKQCEELVLKFAEILN